MLRSRSTDIFAAVTYLTGLCRLSWLTHRNKLTVLVYHDPSPEHFRDHLFHLGKWFNFVRLDDFISGKELQPWPLAVTLDDGYKGNYKLLPAIKESKLNPVIYLNSSLIGTDDSFWFEKIPYKLRETLKDLPDELRLQAVDRGTESTGGASCLTLEQIKEMSGAGVDFGSHSRTHPMLVRCSSEKIKDEIFGSKAELEQKLGISVKHFSYPNGDYNEQITGVVRESGYLSARTVHNGCSVAKSDPYQIKAYVVSDDAGYFKLICQCCGLFSLPVRVRLFLEKLRAIPSRKEGATNVLLTIDSLGVGGAERQMIELARGLADKPGINCQVLTMSDQDHYTALQKSGIIVHRMMRRTRHDWGVFFRMYVLLKRIRPDIVHSWDYMSAIYALPACKILGIKFINGAIRYSSNTLEKILRLKAAVSFPFSDAIVANSQAGLKAHQLLKNNKSFVIHNGIDLNRFDRVNKNIRTDLGIATDKVVGMVATFSSYKDYNTYLIAAQKVLTLRKDVTFMAVGGGPFLDSMKKSVLPIFRDRIIFTGQLRDVESHINIFDIGVLCSTELGEGISNSIMEYMALSKPGIATNVGGTPELVMDGKTGFLVDCGDANGLAEKIVYLLDHSLEATAMGSAGRKRLSEEFTLGKMVDNYIRLYHKIIKRGQ